MNTKRVLAFNPADYRAQWEEQGYLHIPGGVSAEFVDYMTNKVLSELDAPKKELADFKFASKKTQHLFDFDASFDFPRGLYEDVAALTGLPLNRLTLCERHVKAYDQNAEANPVPHKDRMASEIVVGLPVRVPEDSYLVLYPTAPATENPFQSTAQWRDVVSPNEQTRSLLAEVEPVKLYARPGDVVFFQGAKVYHERINPANSVLLFLKLNAMRMDPIGEDLSTAYYEQRTAALAGTCSDDQLLQERIEVSPRLEKVVAYYNRRTWDPVYVGSIWKGKEYVLDDLDVALLKQADLGMGNGAKFMENHAGADRRQVCDGIRKLARLGLVVLADIYPYEMATSAEPVIQPSQKRA
jgi:hypothetical protein